jgi:hypothetical protein
MCEPTNTLVTFFVVLGGVIDIVLAVGSKVPAAHLPLEGKERRRPHVVRFYYGVLKNPTRYDQGLFVSPNSSFVLPVSLVLQLDGCC